MRIQHNIPAMNAYGNYNKNTKALQSNLQKLSSGYKINKAGDDAAGLAISEKMRAQISGLEMAQKNAKDGISLVQTAEGAMTEIHTMLNRMFSLAEQSANGTYDDTVDRAQLNNEFQKLTEEIDRIADATNFNGRKLLNGDLAGGSTSGAAGSKTAATLAIDDAMKLGANAPYSKTDATNREYTLASAVGAEIAGGKTSEVTFTYRDDSGNAKDISIQLKGGATVNDKIEYKIGDGTWIKSGTTSGTGNATKVTAANAGAVLKEALETTDLKDVFDIEADTNGVLKFTAKTEGETKAEILKVMNTADKDATAATAVAANETQTGDAAFESLDVSKMKAWSADTTKTNCTNKAEDVVFTVDGQKFAFANTSEVSAAQAALGNDVTIVELQADDTLDATSATDMHSTMKIKLGYEAAEINADGVTLDFKPVDKGGASSAGGSTGGLRLRVGDSTNSYDDIYVQIKSLNADKLNGTIAEGVGKGETHTLDSLSVDDPDNADIAMGALKDMINYVSTERGNLGATQNRLDHTINNLSTMQENIQDAEATIRDVDVAEEMMKYTKNNILVQSAQAMLAQANQLPQGVLQLLG